MRKSRNLSTAKELSALEIDLESGVLRIDMAQPDPFSLNNPRRLAR